MNKPYRNGSPSNDELIEMLILANKALEDMCSGLRALAWFKERNEIREVLSQCGINFVK